MTYPTRAIGIDFGTTSSKMAWYDPETGQAKVLRNSEGQEETPSIVYYGPLLEEPLVGQGAAHLLEDGVAPARIIVTVKRDLADQLDFALPDDQIVSAQSVVTTILAKLKRDAEEYHFLGEPVTHVVLTCPVAFDAAARDLLRAAAYAAGFREVEMLDEPVAAAIAYARASQWSGKHLAVYDLGGGTFDVAVLARDDGGSFTVVPSPQGLDRCGGEDFDSELFELCLAIAHQQVGPVFQPNQFDPHSLRVRCRRYKETLSRRQSVDVTLLLDGAEEDYPIRFTIQRAHFEQRVRSLLEQTVRLTKMLLERCAERGVQVETLVLIGGSSSIPLVELLLREALPGSVAIDRWGQHTQAVALGAAYRAPAMLAPPPAPAPALFDVARIEQVTRLENSTSSVAAVALGGSLLVARTKDGTIRLWDRHTRQLVRTSLCPAASGDRFPLMIASGDSKTIAASTEKHAIKILSLAEDEDKTLFELAGHAAPVTGLAFDPSQTQLVSGSEDGSVRVWRFKEGSEQTFQGASGPVSAVGWSGDGLLIAAATRGAIVIWHADGQSFQPAIARAVTGSALAFSPDGQWLAVAEDKSIALFFRVARRGFAHLHTLQGHTKRVRALAFSRDGSFLVSGGDDTVLRIWDVTGTPNQVRALDEQTEPVTSLALSHDGAELVSGSESGVLRVWASTRMVRTRAGLDAAAKAFLDTCSGNLATLGPEDLKNGQLLIDCVNAAAREYVLKVEASARAEASELTPGFDAPTIEELDRRAGLEGVSADRTSIVIASITLGIGILIRGNFFLKLISVLLAATGVQRFAARLLAQRQAEAQIRKEAAAYLPQLRGLAEHYLDDIDRLLAP